jgi:peptidyl-prolyl cis-trans isomerase-like 1
MQVSFETTLGTFTVELYTQHAPLACTNLYELAKIGYYDQTQFHRVIKDFCIQGGDPSGTGRGGESIYGPKFADEIGQDLRHVGAGILSCANSGPNTNGSQFFITLAPCQWLDGKHTIFGRVCSGMSVIRSIGSVPTGEGDRPLTKVEVIRATALPLVAPTAAPGHLSASR